MCALLEEAIVNIKAISPAHGAGLEKITRVTCAHTGAIRVLAGFLLPTSGDCDHPALVS